MAGNSSDGNEASPGEVGTATFVTAVQRQLTRKRKAAVPKLPQLKAKLQAPALVRVLLLLLLNDGDRNKWVEAAT